MTVHKQPEARNFKAKALDEVKKFAVLTAYLWVLFFLLGMYRTLLLKENGINPWTQGYVIVNALIFAKVLLLGEILDLGAGLRKRAFVLVVLGRTLLFTALLMGFHVAEEAIGALIKGQPVVERVLHLGGGSWYGVLVYAGLLYVMLLPLTAFREMSYVLGKDVLWDIIMQPETRSREPR